MALDESIWGPFTEWLEHLSSEFLIPSLNYFKNIQVRDDSWISFYIGLGLGIVTLGFLIANPGEPYDYEQNKPIVVDKEEEEEDELPIKHKKKKDKKKKKRQVEEPQEEEQEKKKTSKEKQKEKVKKNNNNNKEGKGDTLVVTETEIDNNNEEIELPEIDAKATTFLKGLMKMSQDVADSNAKAVDDATSMLLGIDQDQETSKKKKKKKNKKIKQADGITEKDDEEDDEEVENDDDDIPRDPFSDPNIKRKARKAAKLFGLSESQFEEAVQNAKIEFDTGEAPSAHYDNVLSIASFVNMSILGAVTVGCIWALNKDYDNAATKVFIANFPREAAMLGFKWPGGPSPMNSVYNNNDIVDQIE